eukprot:1822004-Rhodomonas_salina.1
MKRRRRNEPEGNGRNKRGKRPEKTKRDKQSVDSRSRKWRKQKAVDARRELFIKSSNAILQLSFASLLPRTLIGSPCAWTTCCGERGSRSRLNF